MKLFLISQYENDRYDTYDSAVVAAPNEEIARFMDPGIGEPVDFGDPWSSWCSRPDLVNVRYIGEAAEGIEQHVICASFNAG